MLDTGFPGPGLTVLGLAQAAAIPAALAGEKVAGLYASRLVRSQLTAAPLAEECGLGVVIRDGLEEIGAGALESASDDDAYAAYIGTLVAWSGGDLRRRMPGGPDGREFFDRYDAAVSAMVAAHGPDDTVVAISHGAAIRVWSSVRAATTPDVGVERGLMNTGVVIVEGDPENGWKLVDWREEPLGGLALGDGDAEDVTGHAPAEIVPTPDEDADSSRREGKGRQGTTRPGWGASGRAGWRRRRGARPPGSR